MTIKADIELALNQAQVLGAGPLQIAAGSGRILSDLLAVDAIGCSCERLAYETPRLAGLSIERLKKISEALTSRLTYLLEPIGLIETDADSATLQMRSNPPHQDDDGTKYYELLVRRGGDIVLCRYAKTPGQPRQVIPAQLTREVFARLAEDFVAATP